MPKRKAAAGEQVPNPKIRKRQGVTKTSKSSTIALIRENAARSPLLSLPSEVRECILKHLLGDRLVHLKYLECLEEDTYNAARGVTRKNPEKFGSYRHVVCSNLKNFNYKEEALVDSHRHDDCVIYDCMSKNLRTRTLLHCQMGNALTVLSVCRQLYEESNFILWSTNPFSFDQDKSLITFITSLNQAQRRNFKKLHLIINAGWIRIRHNRWIPPLDRRHLFLFRGLESLKLCIEHDLSRVRWPNAPTYSEDESRKLWKRYIDRVDLVPLQALPINQLQLVISDTIQRDPRMISYFLTEEIKAKYASELREKLLNPRGTNLQKHLEEEAKPSRRESQLKVRLDGQERRLRAAQDSLQWIWCKYTRSAVSVSFPESGCRGARREIRLAERSGATLRDCGLIAARALKRKITTLQSSVSETKIPYAKAVQAAQAAKAASVAFEADTSNQLLESIEQ